MRFKIAGRKIKILSNLKIDESRLPQDGRFHMDVGKKSVDLRVSILPLIYGEKIVMRILDKTSQAPTLEQLGVRGRALQWIEENIKKTHGIFLITGPTGSGKSTTLYSILINNHRFCLIALTHRVKSDFCFYFHFSPFIITFFVVSVL